MFAKHNHWTYDTWMLAHGTAAAVMKSGGDTWFFLTADYSFGHALERDASAVLLANGGKVLGSVRHPLNNQDFSSFLVQAQHSKAKITVASDDRLAGFFPASNGNSEMVLLDQPVPKRSCSM